MFTAAISLVSARIKLTSRYHGNGIFCEWSRLLNAKISISFHKLYMNNYIFQLTLQFPFWFKFPMFLFLPLKNVRYIFFLFDWWTIGMRLKRVPIWLREIYYINFILIPPLKGMKLTPLRSISAIIIQKLACWSDLISAKYIIHSHRIIKHFWPNNWFYFERQCNK